MKHKNENGIAGVDVVLAILALMIFSSLIITLIYNNALESSKLKKETLAMIYITEIFEKIAIADYAELPNGNYINLGNNIYSTNIENLIPNEMIGKYKVDLNITQELDGVKNNKDIMKKITVSLTYSVANKNYKISMQRMKIKE